MQTSNPEHFFETDAEQAKRLKRAAKSANTYGSPIVLKNKISAAILNPRCPSASLFVASGQSVCTVHVPDGKLGSIYRGPALTITSLAIGGPDSTLLFAGSWDKTIWSWDIASNTSYKRYIGHSDFVKTVTCARIGGNYVLISGGSDRRIVVWDIASAERLHTLDDTASNMLGLQNLVVDPLFSDADEIQIFSASSDPKIRRWKIRLDSWKQITELEPNSNGQEIRFIQEHETTVYKLVFEDGVSKQLWTASGDGNSKSLSRSKNFATEATFRHGDHVRSVAVVDLWVITAGRDEYLKIWDRSSGKLYCTIEGHFDEVMDLILLEGEAKRVCSVSLDGTVRTWLLKQPELDALVLEQRRPAAAKDETGATRENMLTATEEAELAELMCGD